MNKNQDLKVCEKDPDCLKMNRRTFLKAVGAAGAAACLGTYKANIVDALDLAKTGTTKSRIYVLASIPNAGKTTTAISMKNYFELQGMKVACLQSITKGYQDTGKYLKYTHDHFSIPIEATRSKEALEKWLPYGYDIFILEVSSAYVFPISAARISLFDNINELMPYDMSEDWDGNITKKYKNLPFLDVVRNRNVKPVITKSPEKMNCASVDSNFMIHNIDDFVYDEVEPKMVLSKSDKKVISVGAIPAEFCNMYPNLKWYDYDYPGFYNAYKEEDYDFAIIGDCNNDEMRFSFRPDKPVICYKPSVYIDNLIRFPKASALTDKDDVFSLVTTANVGTHLGKDGCRYEAFNNKYWIKHEFMNLDTITTDNNIIFCNGWVLPQHLIQEGYMEV